MWTPLYVVACSSSAIESNRTSNPPLRLFANGGAFFFLSLSRSRSLAVLFLFSKSRLDLFLRAVRLSFIIVWGLLGIGAKGGVVFCRPARRRRRRRLHSARTSVPRRRAEVLRIERGFAFGACALPRFAARARFGRLEEGSRLVSMCISLFYFGCYFFFEFNKPSRRYLYSRERVGIVLTQRRMHLFLLSVLFRAKPVETNARREVRDSGEEKRLRAFTRVSFQVLVSKN